MTRRKRQAEHETAFAVFCDSLLISMTVITAGAGRNDVPGSALMLVLSVTATFVLANRIANVRRIKKEEAGMTREDRQQEIDRDIILGMRGRSRRK